MIHTYARSRAGQRTWHPAARKIALSAPGSWFGELGALNIERVNDKRPSLDADRLLSVTLQGVAMRHAKWRELRPEEIAAAVPELWALAGDWADLLANRLAAGYGRNAERAARPFRR